MNFRVIQDECLTGAVAHLVVVVLSNSRPNTSYAYMCKYAVNCNIAIWLELVFSEEVKNHLNVVFLDTNAHLIAADWNSAILRKIHTNRKIARVPIGNSRILYRWTRTNRITIYRFYHATTPTLNLQHRLAILEYDKSQNSQFVKQLSYYNR